MEDDHRITETIAKATLEADIPGATFKSLEVAPRPKTGENFICEVRRFKVAFETSEGKRETRDYVAKCLPMNETRVNWIDEAGAMEAEIVAYEKLLPAFNKGHENDAISAPKVFFTSNSVIVMEDLHTLGFKMADKLVGLDVQQMKSALEELAKLHAYSNRYIEQEIGVEKFKQEFGLFVHDLYIREEATQFIQLTDFFFDTTDKIFSGILETEDPDLASKFKAYSEKKNEIHDNVQKVKDSDFNVFLHNDAWGNNFLFNEDASKAKIIDFQLCRRGSAALDLSFLFMTSSEPEFRRRHLDELLAFYHERLQHHLGGGDLYPLEKIRSDYDFVYGFGFAQSITSSAFVVCAPGDLTVDDIDMEDEVKFAQQMKEFLEGQISNVELRRRALDVTREAVEKKLF